MEERRVVTCFLEDRGKVLRLRRSRRVRRYQGRWAGVSGTVDLGATPLPQALVEIQQETGLCPADVDLVAAGTPLVIEDTTLGRRWIVHPFRFAVRFPERLRLDWEHTECAWIDPAAIPAYATVPGPADAWAEVTSTEPESADHRFDLVPGDLITASITEHGLVLPSAVSATMEPLTQPPACPIPLMRTAAKSTAAIP